MVVPRRRSGLGTPRHVGHVSLLENTHLSNAEHARRTRVRIAASPRKSAVGRAPAGWPTGSPRQRPPSRRRAPAPPPHSACITTFHPHYLHHLAHPHHLLDIAGVGASLRPHDLARRGVDHGARGATRGSQRQPSSNAEPERRPSGSSSRSRSSSGTAGSADRDSTQAKDPPRGRVFADVEVCVGGLEQVTVLDAVPLVTQVVLCAVVCVVELALGAAFERVAVHGQRRGVQCREGDGRAGCEKPLAASPMSPVAMVRVMVMVSSLVGSAPRAGAATDHDSDIQ